MFRERLAGTMGGDSCLSCHGLGEGSELQIGKGDPTQAETCALCHVNVDTRQIGGSTADGEGESPLLPTDQIHQR